MFEKKRPGLEHGEAGLARGSKESQGRTTPPRSLCADCPWPPDRLRALYAPALALASERRNRGGEWKAATRWRSRSAASTCAQARCATPPALRCIFCPARFRLTGPPRWSASSPQPSARVRMVSVQRGTTAPGSPRAHRALSSARSGARTPGDRGPPEVGGGPQGACPARPESGPHRDPAPASCRTRSVVSGPQTTRRGGGAAARPRGIRDGDGRKGRGAGREGFLGRFVK